MPRSLFARLLWLLLAVLAIATALSLLVSRSSLREAAIAAATRNLETAIAAADALLAGEDRARGVQRMHALGMERATEPPPRAPHSYAWWREVETALASRLAGRPVHVVERPRPMLWVAASAPVDGWVGIPLPDLREPLLRSSLLALLVSLVVVAVAAAWAARRLVLPLRELARAAPRIALGEQPSQVSAHAPAEVVELARALEGAALDVREAARERELMLAGISHDLRTPLARIGLALEMIDADAPLREGMVADVAELDAMLGQFIAYVRDGRDETVCEADAGAVLDEALMKQTRAGRAWQRSGLADIAVATRPLALRRALDNLLENAWRHGAAPFEAELRREKGVVVFVVRDRGGGVAAADLARLGRPFARLDDARSGPGSGLGLAIVARFATRQGGALHFRNRTDGGFEAELRLPGAMG